MDSDHSTDFTDSEQENNSSVGTQKGRRNIRNVKLVEELSAETRLSNIKEDERLKRIEQLRKKFELYSLSYKNEDQFILDYDFINHCPLVTVHKTLAMKLKEHQKEGIKFMWTASYESVEQIEKSEGSGCILAHCMGLGKTFQVITLIHTLLNHTVTKTKTVLICCPKNTLLNWINEFKMWISSEINSIDIYNPTRYEDQDSRLLELATWQLNGGVCVINYELFRILLEEDNKNIKQFTLKSKLKFRDHLLNPGPDLIVCDEGHILKNEETKLSKIISQIRTKRRIVLTGTPMQNNLIEYHCMIQFVKPFLLGTRQEFLNMFVNPILNGQYENSLVADVRLMKERSYILHKKLTGCVQRFDLSILKKFLPEKFEYVISVPLTDTQIDLYRFYLENYSAKGDPNWSKRTALLFADYQALQRVWTHPYVLKLFEDKYAEFIGQKSKKNKKNKKKKGISYDDDEFENLSDVEHYHWSRYPLSWWNRFASIDAIEDARQSHKLILLLKILKECEEAGDKVLVFTVSLFSLNMIIHFLKRIDKCEFEKPELCNMLSTWEENEDFVILTGQTSTKDRDILCKRFNNPSDIRLRVFLISTKAGGMGISLTAANRAVLFDVSWNPSHDTQSTFRIFRMGQTKPCYIYRFVSSGTMEEKMYERQVAKQSISHRVVDELETARHFTRTELSALYTLEPYKKKSFTYIEIKDSLLRKILEESPEIVQAVHEHDSLLEHKEDEELQEMDKNKAWTAYQNDNDYEILPEDVKQFLEALRPEDFDPHYLKLVLKRKHPDASEKEIEETISNIMPEVQSILNAPDFLDKMKRQALLAYNNISSGEKGSQRKGIARRSKVDTSIIILDESKENNNFEKKNNLKSPYVIDIVSSDSDDSAFQFESLSKARKRKRIIKPLKSWGTRNGKKYGTPDID